MKKEMVEYNDNFISKIRKFFSNLFKKQQKEEVMKVTGEKTEIDKKDEFQEKIEVKKDEDEIKILNLQKKYKSGKIKEEEISDDDRKKLIELYKKQNKELKEKIALKRENIRKKLAYLKEN